MRKKVYQTPATKVVQLKHRTQMLSASTLGGQGSLRNYNWHDENEGTGVQNYLWNNETQE